jgi:hypothetical protein
VPTVLVESGFRIFFYSDEGFEPPHVHIEYQGAVSKFWVNPVQFAGTMGMRASQIKKASNLIEKHEKLILEKWNEFFSKKV